jgi:CBS domain-containing protein
MSKKHQVKKQVTAGDIMTRGVITVSQQIPASEAAKTLYSKAISGVPVIDEQERCVGMFSAADFTRISQAITEPHAPPVACPFQVHHRGVDGTEGTICTLPAGLCPLQRPQQEEGTLHNLCCFPHEIVVEWQALQPPLSIKDPVKRWMTAPAITINQNATVSECAERMTQAHIHRLVVVDEHEHVKGLLSSMDVLASIANSTDD